MALVAAGENTGNVDYLKNVTETEAVKLAAPILAITALGQDPRSFGAQNLVSQLKKTYKQNQLGDTATMNDDIFGLLALVSAGENNEDLVVNGTKNFILNHQNSDGGWGFQVNGSSDTNMTAMAIMALIKAGEDGEKINQAVNYLKNSQNNDGGFPYDKSSTWSSVSDASSDAWVISAIYCLGQDPYNWTKNGKNPVDHLKSLLANEGYFHYQTGSNEDSFSTITTAYAVIALSGKYYPINTINVRLKEYAFRIEGSSETICSGQIGAVTALDIVKNAQEICSFNYLIENMSFGPYLKKINTDEAQGLKGWLYLVNYNSPTVGAADYQLQENDEVIWFYGEWTDQPLKISVDKTEVGQNENITATVNFFSQSGWQPLTGAQILDKVTDSSGQTILSFTDGYYRLSAKKNGFIRSNQINLKVGNPQENSVSLKVEIEKGQVAGDETNGSGTISFSVEPNELNFGKLKNGANSSQKLKITNNGSTAMHIEAKVDGDELFRNNLQLNDKFWLYFSENLEQNQNRDITAQLSVPASYGGSAGSKQGALIFWAMAQ